MNKVEIIERLKSEASTDYRGYLEMLLRHIEEYGETPALTYIGKTFKNYSLYKDREYLRNGSLIKGDAEQAVIINNQVYEVTNDNDLYLVECSVDFYKNYRMPMCYNAYIDII